MYLKYTSRPILTQIESTKKSFECFLYLSIKIPKMYVDAIENTISHTYFGSP